MRTASTSPNRRSVLLGSVFAGLLGAGWLAGCSHDWDAFDPRLGAISTAGTGGTGAGQTTSNDGGTGAGSTTSNSGGSGGETSSTSSGGTGGTTTSSSASTGGGGTGGDTGGGGTGGGEPVPCGGTSVLSDDFDGTGADNVWNSSQTDAVLDVVGGELVITLPNGDADGSYADLYTEHYYDLRNDSISVEVKSAGNTATTAYAYFGAGIDGDNYLEIYQEEGSLHLTKEVAGNYVLLKKMQYNPVSHLHWRIRDDGVNVHWETSADGTVWVSQIESPTNDLFPLDLVQLSMGGGTDGGEVNPGEVHFDRVNGGGPPEQKWCPVSSITDDFADGMLDFKWNRSWEDYDGMMTEVGGELVLAYVPNDTAYAAYGSASSFDLTNSAITVEVPVTADAMIKASARLTLIGPGGNEIEIGSNNGQLDFTYTVMDVEDDYGSVLYSPVAHRWWRLRESDGTLYWETAPDGKTWTSQAELSPIPFAIDAFDVYLRGGTWMASPAPGEAHFDNLNLPPP